MHDLIIVGVGPRGLAIAIQAIEMGLDICLIDPTPNKSWTVPNIIRDMQMRSPISFDLTTFIPELYKLSLANFLNHDLTPNNQRQVEDNDIPVYRYQFCSYLNFIYSYVIDKVTYINSKVVTISNLGVGIDNEEFIYGRNIVLAVGNEYSIANQPNWLDLSVFNNKSVSLSYILSQDISNKKVIVVGSGQGAAEVVNHLSNNNYVYWVCFDKQRIDKYPAPSYRVWGYKTALGDYYKGLSWDKRLSYLSKIKQWQPSITPYIHNKLIQNTNYKKIEVSSYKDIEKEVDYVVLMAGRTTNPNAIPLSQVRSNPYLPQFLDLDKGFKLKGFDNIYATGTLATAYDGPRQNSLISAALTAKEILNNAFNS